MGNESELTFAFVFRNIPGCNYEKSIQALRDINIPKGCRVECVVVEDNGSLAAAYNMAIKQSSAKYKIYVNRDIERVDANLLHSLCMYFMQLDFTVGIIGLWGSEMPADGDYTKARSMYGRYVYFDGNDRMKIDAAIDPVFFQEVRCLDNSFIATAVDVEWDERMGDDFAVAAQCLRLEEKGYKAIVAMQCVNMNAYWVAFSDNHSKKHYKIAAQNSTDFEVERRLFMKYYTRQILPLVSILIPTYNQPEYFRQALESALAQDYKNTEIIVGDDSTDERTKNLIKPYLNKYSNIKYYYHGGPLGKKGINNIHFILSHSNGEYINYLLHDDLIYPDKISKMMDLFLQDLNKEIGLVASVRDFIDENGKKFDVLSIYNPFHDKCFSSHELGRKTLHFATNFIGELTNALIPKEMLYVSEIKDYGVGYFCGVKDESMCDVSTWLEIGRRGKKTVFLSDILSAFRSHSMQNTHDPDMQIRGFLDWYMLIVVAWLNNVYLEDEEQCFHACRWLSTHRQPLVDVKKLDTSRKQIYQKYADICQAALENNRRLMFHLIITYIMEKAVCPADVQRLCEKNTTTGYWQKHN